MIKKTTAEDFIKKISHISYISLDISTYVNSYTKARFIDCDFGEFWARCDHVVKNRGNHPARKLLKKRETCLAKYGSEEPMRSLEIQKRQKETNITKYGVENVAQNKDVRAKIKNTTIKRYGYEYAITSDEIKDKQKATNLKKYGVENVSQNKEISNRIKNTMQERYGVETYVNSKHCRDKQAESVTKYTFEEISISTICKENNVPYSFVSKIARAQGVEDAANYIANYTNNKTNIELIIEKAIKIERFNKKAIKDIKYRPDFKITENCFLDADGLYWHSDAAPTPHHKLYHFKKQKDYSSSGLRLFQFREDEINQKLPIVKSIVEHYIGKSSKIQGRKTKIKKVEQKDAKMFLTSSHLMGSTKAKHIGLYLEEELVCLMSYVKDISGILKIQRFCNKLNTTVIGGFSKLLNFIENKENPVEVHNWVDLRYGTGKHLENKGFILTRETLGWKWTDTKNTYNRRSCRANMDERQLSEKEHAIELSLYKIYDAGQRLYVKKI